jgi:hypothetical protein
LEARATTAAPPPHFETLRTFATPPSAAATFAAVESGLGARSLARGGPGARQSWHAAGFCRFGGCGPMKMSNEKRLELLPALAAPFLRWGRTGFKEQAWKPALRQPRHDAFQNLSRIRYPALCRRRFCCRCRRPWRAAVWNVAGFGVRQASAVVARVSKPASPPHSKTLRALRPRPLPPQLFPCPLITVAALRRRYDGLTTARHLPWLEGVIAG